MLIDYTPFAKFQTAGTITLYSSSLNCKSSSPSVTCNINSEAATGCSATYATHTISITFKDISRSITSNDVMHLTIAGLMYNSMMSAIPMTFNAYSNIACDDSLLETTINTKDWVPFAPAVFGPSSVSMSPLAGEVCTDVTINFTLIPYLSVPSGSAIVIDLDGISNLASAPTSFTLSTTGDSLSSTTTSKWWGTFDGNTKAVTLLMEKFPLPLAEKPFRFIFKTYSSSNIIASNLVHRNISEYFHATRSTFPSPSLSHIERVTNLKQMLAPSSLAVSTLAVYKIVVTVGFTCQPAVSTGYKIAYPATFSGACAYTAEFCSFDNSAHVVTLKAGDQGITADDHGNFAILFSLVNPISARPLDGTFTVTAYNDSAGEYASYEYTDSLSLTGNYVPSAFLSFTVTPSSRRIADLSDYNFSVSVNDTIPKDAVLVIRLDPGLTVPATVCSGSIPITICNIATNIWTTVTPNPCTYDLATHNLTVDPAFVQSYAIGTEITVLLKGATNPLTISTLSFGFACQSGGYEMDNSSATVLINQPAATKATCAIVDPTNAARTNYNCNFELLSNPTKLENYYLDLTFDQNITKCELNTVVPTSSGVDSNPMTLVLSSGSYSSPLSFTLTCDNPPSTQPATVAMSLYTIVQPSTDHICLLEGTATVSTSTGQVLTSSCENLQDPVYPGYPTKVTLKVSRNVTLTTNIASASIVLPSGSTTSGTVAATCDPACTASSFKAQTVSISFVPAIDTASITVTLTGLYNPTAVSATPGKFGVKTFHYSNYTALIDQSDLCPFNVGCDSPCKECLLSQPAKCTSCQESSVAGMQLYFYNDTNECGDSCTVSKGFFLNGTWCTKCDDSCSLCQGWKFNCTTCNKGQLLLNGGCLDKCPDKYFSNGISCDNCDPACATCNDKTTCNTCVDGKFHYAVNMSCLSDCPYTYYKNTSTHNCDMCNSKLCCGCSSATVCTSCECISLYFKDGKCLSHNECIAYEGYLPIDSTCSQCQGNCLTCSGALTTCNSCKNNLILSGTGCVPKCDDGDYAYTNPTTKITACQHCDPSCATCSESGTCISCKGETSLEEDTSKCVSSCKNNYYNNTSNHHCVPCINCATCSGPATYCTSCADGFLLYDSKKTCVKSESCQTGTYLLGTTCYDCDKNCSACSGGAKYCTGCAAGYSLESNVCVPTCSEGKTPSNGACKSCTNPLCSACAGDTCTACKAGYLYNLNCTAECSGDGKVKGPAHGNYTDCLDCPTNCGSCFVSSDGTTVCSVCSSKDGTQYYLYDTSCVLSCPDGYKPDGYRCVKAGGSVNNSTGNNTATSSGAADYLPFPHLIAAGALGFVAVAGQARDPRSMVVSNIVMMWSYAAVCSYAVQALLALGEGETMLFLVSAGVVAISVLINLAFLVYYFKRISIDSGFVTWAEAHRCVRNWIVSLSSTFSMQTSRLYYSRLLGFSLFFVQFGDFMNILIPLNVFSLLQLLFVQFPILVLDIIALNKISWGSQLYITLIESLVLSALLIILLCYEMKSSKQTRDELVDDTKYTKINDETNLLQSINDTTAKPFNEDELRRKVLEDVSIKLGLAKSDAAAEEQDTTHNPSLFHTARSVRPRRRRSFESTSGVDREKDPRESHSYPSSPRTAKSKEVPLKEYGIDEDAVISPYDLPDNVYSESQPPSLSASVVLKEDAEVQTPPFQKLQAFKKHLRAEDHRRAQKNKKLFEVDANGERMISPLEPIAESPEDNDERRGNVVEESKDNAIPEDKSLPSHDIEPKEMVLMREMNESPTAAVATVGEETKSGANATSDEIFPMRGNGVMSPDPGTNEKYLQSSPSAGPIILDSFAGGAEEGENSAATEKNRKTLRSPPQQLPESVDPVLSAPLNPVGLGSISGPAVEEEEEERKAGPRTLAVAQKTPGVFDEDGFKFSIASLKADGALSEKKKIEETKHEITVEDVKTHAAEPQEPDQRKEEVTQQQNATENGETNTKLEEVQPPETMPQTEKPGKEELPLQYVEDEEIMGSFERDPADGCILIRENDTGQLVDMRSRKVNRHGYMVDDQQNIVNRKGEVIFRYDEVAKELGDDPQPPVVKTNNLLADIVAPTETKTSIVAEAGNNRKEATPVESVGPAMNSSEDGSSSRKSVTVNPLMGDTPSNYNIQNQRYDDPLDSQSHRRGSTGLRLPKRIVHDEPREEPVQGRPVRHVRRKHGGSKSKSASKRAPEKLFTINKVPGSNKDSGAVSDIDRKRKLSTPAEPDRRAALTKPQTARNSIRPIVPAVKRRAQSRGKAIAAERGENNDELEQAYGENLESMFLQSDEGEVSAGPSSVSKASHTSLVAPRLKGLEAIYLQRLESSTKHRKKLARRGRMRREVSRIRQSRGAESASESEHDEISSMLAENYNEMQSQFFRQQPNEDKSAETPGNVAKR